MHIFINFHTNNGKVETCRFESCSRQIGVNTMAEKVAIWEPTEYKSVCTHCGTTNFSKTPSAQHLCIECNKEYLATVAHTEED